MCYRVKIQRVVEIPPSLGTDWVKGWGLYCGNSGRGFFSFLSAQREREREKEGGRELEEKREGKLKWREKS